MSATQLSYMGIHESPYLWTNKAHYLLPNFCRNCYTKRGTLPCSVTVPLQYLNKVILLSITCFEMQILSIPRLSMLRDFVALHRQLFVDWSYMMVSTMTLQPTQ